MKFSLKDEDETIIFAALTVGYYLVYIGWIFLLFFNVSIGSISIDDVAVPGIFLGLFFFIGQVITYSLLAEESDFYKFPDILLPVIFWTWLLFMFPGLLLSELKLFELVASLFIALILDVIVGLIINVIFRLVVKR